jgi:hypothetical protein
MFDTSYAANRPFDVFVTGDSKDIALIENVAEWLKRSCGFQLAPLGDTTDVKFSARIFVFVLSRDAFASKKLMGLINSVMQEVRENTGLRFIALLQEDIPDEEVPRIIVDHGFIRIRGDCLNTNDAVAILEAIYLLPPDLRPDGLTVRDVYFSRSWLNDTAESQPADQVCRHASKFGFRLIGDTEDPEFDTDVRLPMIMAGCGGFVGVLPHRSGTSGTSDWILEELRMATAAKLPCLIVKDPRVSLPEEFSRTRNILGMVDYLTGQDWTIRLDSLLQSLGDRWCQPADPVDVLYLSDDDERIDTVNGLVVRITAMALTTLNRPLTDRRVLLELVQNADVVLCDLPCSDVEGWMVAGYAIALDRKIEILMRAPEHGRIEPPSFIPVYRYTSELDRLGQLHRILRRHRRKIMNPDQPCRLAKERNLSRKGPV